MYRTSINSLVRAEVLVRSSTLLSILALLAIPARAVSDDAFIIFDAIVTPEKQKQPTYVALSTRGSTDFVHLPTGLKLHPLKAGKYSIAHIDFDTTYVSSTGTVDLDRSQALLFEVIPGTVTYVGLLDLKHRGGAYSIAHYDIELRTDQNLLNDACAREGGMPDHLPIVFMTDAKAREVAEVRCR